jgi:hypothetical protein
MQLSSCPAFTLNNRKRLATLEVAEGDLQGTAFMDEERIVMKEAFLIDEERDAIAGDPPVSLAYKIGLCVGIVLAAIAAVVLFIALGDKPFGIQIATLIAYSGTAFFFVFCRSRGLRGYSLRNKAVQREIPRLLAIHAAFLVSIFIVQTSAFHLRSSLPSYLLTENRGRFANWSVRVLIVFFCVCYFCSGVHFSKDFMSQS